MKVIEFNILKKNRKYFAATKNGYKCKILIDNNSKDLNIGTQELKVDDISVRSKYGTDLIFKLSTSEINEDKLYNVSLKHFKYNKYLVESCKNLGGKWDAETKAWLFRSFVEDQVEELDYIYNSELVLIELEALEECYAGCSALYFCGYQIGYATGRDSGAELCEDISLVSGELISSGSMKNWATEAKEGSRFRLEVPRKVLEKYGTFELSKHNWKWKEL